MKYLQRSVITAWCLCLCTIVVAEDAQKLTITATPGKLVASQADGTTVWQVDFQDSLAPSWTQLDNGFIVLDNGYVIDGKCGLIVARGHNPPGGDEGRGGGDSARGACPYWSDLAEIDSSTYPLDILFDSQGNAWAISGPPLQVRRSNGHDGTWQEPEEAIPSANSGTGSVASVIDSDDNITILYKTDGGLYAIRYEPGTGWSDPTLVHPTSSRLRAGVDSWGNVVATFNDGGVWSVVYDAVSGTWSAAEQVSPEGTMPTVIQNRSGDAIYLLYLRRTGYETPYYVYSVLSHTFDSENKVWSPFEILPDTTWAKFSMIDSGSRIPGAVDHLGNATVFYARGSEFPPGSSRLCASRRENGVWQMPHSFEFWYGATDIYVFGDADVSEYGDVLCAFQRAPVDFRGDRIIGHVTLPHILYRASVGWDEIYNAYDVGNDGTIYYQTRSRVAFYRGANAAATFYGLQGDEVQLVSLLYNGTDWANETTDIPGPYVAWFQESAGGLGTPLLAFLATDGGPNYGLQATWLRNIAGDLDGDGDVDLEDLATLLASYGVDAGGDIDGDGDTDLTDLAALLGNYGEEIP